MKNITININTENDAFVGFGSMELTRILKDIANKIENGECPERIRDTNGNTVGHIEYEK